MVSRRVVQGEETSYVLAWSEQFPQRTAASMGSDTQELRRLANGLLRTREMERSRVAAELHNEVVSPVVMAKFMVEDAIRHVTGGAYAEGVELLNSAISQLREVMGEVRRISTELRPSMLDDLGLLPTIEWLCRTFEQTCRSVGVERQIAVTEVELPEHLKLVIFRIAEELLANVAQHANASHVQVSLARDANDLLVRVQDDGDGFDTALLGHSANQLRGIGLSSIRKRVEATGGRLALDSMPNKGATIAATWTLPPRTTPQ
jgi:two-component system NarL family sensor kinase